jgi:hypothetical protein
MRAALILIFAVVFVSTPAVAQEKQSPKDSDAKPLQSYIVEITEVHLSAEAAQGLKVNELARSLERLTQDGHVDLVEKVRLSVLARHESIAQFGLQTAITQGTVATREGLQRNTMMVHVGTMVQVSAEPHHEDVLLKLKFEASRLGKEIPEDHAPDIETVSFSSELLLRPGKPVVAIGSTAKGGAYLLVSIVE